MISERLRTLERQILADPLNTSLIDPYLNILERLGIINHDLKEIEASYKDPNKEDDWRSFLWYFEREPLKVVPSNTLVEADSRECSPIMIPFLIKKIINRKDYMRNRSAAVSLFPENHIDILRPLLVEIINDRTEGKFRAIVMFKLSMIADQSTLENITKIANDITEESGLRRSALRVIEDNQQDPS